MQQNRGRLEERDRGAGLGALWLGLLIRARNRGHRTRPRGACEELEGSSQDGVRNTGMRAALGGPAAEEELLAWKHCIGDWMDGSPGRSGPLSGPVGARWQLTEDTANTKEDDTLEEHRRPPPAFLVATLAEHSQRFNEILSAVLEIKTTLEPKIDALRIDMGHMREDHKKVKEQVEATGSTLRPTVEDAISHIRALQKEVTQLQQRVEDQEGRSRHNNICVEGLPKREEDPSMDLYIEDWLSKTAVQGKHSSFSSVDRAYWVPGRLPPLGPPASSSAHFFN
ncbi:hypothetical protein NDU88_001868 [Pleurodeles waltl]|uniref:Uncharacterized protein n=1 Tax=Pleurodeles waltl TaxID=8319 RepID=A0AAV7U822_PLEWA|nr:hypothetical protein NDU88_001868 [Pleurodeles waltl]